MSCCPLRHRINADNNNALFVLPCYCTFFMYSPIVSCNIMRMVEEYSRIRCCCHFAERQCLLSTWQYQCGHWLAIMICEGQQHPTCSPGLAPNDFYLMNQFPLDERISCIRLSFQSLSYNKIRTGNFSKRLQ